MNKYSLKKNFKISEENAHEQIMILLERYDIDIDSKSDEVDSETGQSPRESFEETIDKVTRCIRLGQIEVFEDDNSVKTRLIIQNKSENANVSELVFGELEGEDHTRIPTSKNPYKQMHGLLGSMCETPNGEAILKKIKSSDAKAAVALSVLFL